MIRGDEQPSDEEPSESQAQLKQVHQTIRARQNIYRARDETEDVHVICNGWAFRFVQLAEGRRQILSFLLPGDFESSASIFKSHRPFSIQALTDVHYCKFNRVDMQTRITEQPHVLKELARFWGDEQDCADHAIASLGQQSAEARISGLIIMLMERLRARGMAHNSSFSFPLRQQHIADAVGLTPVHVSRVIGQFHMAGIVRIAQRQIEILDETGLRRIANAR